MVFNFLINLRTQLISTNQPIRLCFRPLFLHSVLCLPTYPASPPNPNPGSAPGYNGGPTGEVSVMHYLASEHLSRSYSYATVDELARRHILGGSS